MFTSEDYRILHKIVFNDNYPGYRPNVIESPNGDGVKDTQKRYAHVSQKYLDNNRHQSAQGWIKKTIILERYLEKAHNLALDTAVQLGISPQFWPDIRYSALRVLEYPPGAGSAAHTDFDLFTLNLYRNLPNKLLKTKEIVVGEGVLPLGVHAGELLQLLMTKGNFSIHATPHKVIPSELNNYQYSIVYFAIPDHAAVLPSGETVGQWIEERLKRSRYDV